MSLHLGQIVYTSFPKVELHTVLLANIFTCLQREPIELTARLNPPSFLDTLYQFCMKMRQTVNRCIGRLNDGASV